MKQVRAASILGLLMGACDAPRYSAGDAAALAPGAACLAAHCADDAAASSADRRVADSGLDPSEGATRGHSPDAAAPHDAAEKGSAIEDAAASMLSPEAAALQGTYAIQVRFHGKDSTLGTLAPLSNELLFLATIELDASDGALRMTGQLCRDHGVVKGPFSQLLAEKVRPELQPLRHWNVIVQDGVFHTEGPATRVGYEQDAPAGCSPGARLLRRPAQVWLGGADASCTCPSSDLPPTLPSDCRVNDPDRDGHPGVTIALAGAVESEDYVRLKDSSQFVDGIVASGKRHRSSFDKLEELYQLQCAHEGCARANLQVCPAKSNTALFSPLTDMASDGQPWSCEVLLEEIAAGRHFADEPLEFPSGC